MHVLLVYTTIITNVIKIYTDLGGSFMFSDIAETIILIQD